MIELLTSNLQPLRTENNTFSSKFNELLSNCEQIDIAVGYISEDSLAHLANFIYKNGKPFCNIIIGMHYFDYFTYSQYAIAKEMETFLKVNKLGSVKLVTSFPFHGKIYSFHRKNNNISVIGSSNMTNILLHQPIRQYEVDLLIDDEVINMNINSFISSLLKISSDLSSPNLKLPGFKQVNNLLDGLPDVNIINNEVLQNIKSKISKEEIIYIPISTAEKAASSNINACFGKGRENKKTGVIKNRSWYEVELIVPKKITCLPNYPKNVIKVITDDGYQFECKISGTNNKNFRSTPKLTILGKWLKGRLENAGVLKVGQMVTDEVLVKYGTSHIKMSFIKKNEWFLDFEPD